MGKKKQDKVENNILYLEEQARRFLRHEYRINYKVEIHGHKKIESEGYYSRTIFERGKPIGIDVSYNVLASSGKETILKVTLREVVRIALWHMRKPYHDGSKEYEVELHKKGLPRYGTESHTGKELHTYTCSKCDRIYFLKDKKLPKSKDPTLQEVRSSCCGERFMYKGKVNYSNEKLQRIARGLKKGG